MVRLKKSDRLAIRFVKITRRKNLRRIRFILAKLIVGFWLGIEEKVWSLRIEIFRSRLRKHAQRTNRTLTKSKRSFWIAIKNNQIKNIILVIKRLTTRRQPKSQRKTLKEIIG